MVGHNNNNNVGEDIKWSEKNEDALLAILDKRVQKNPCAKPSFKLADWHSIDEELFLVLGVRYGANRLQGKYNRLRIQHRLFSELISHTGVTYDSSSNKVFAADEVWKMFKMKDKGYMTFRAKGFRNYAMLGQIFDTSTSTGLLHHASTQPPLNSDEELQNKEEIRCQMVGHNNNNVGEDMKWSEKNEDAFLTILRERVQKDPNGTPNFKLANWHDMDEELFLVLGIRYGANRLQGKFNRLRQKHRQFSELISHPGVTYKSSSNKVFAPDEVWQMFKMKHKNYTAFKSKGCRNYEILDRIYNKSTATKLFPCASTKLPTNLDEESQNENEILSQGVHVAKGEKSYSGGSNGKRAMDDHILSSNRGKKEPKFEKFDSSLDMLPSSLSARAECDLSKPNRHKEMFYQARNPSYDPFSIDECMDVLESLNDVSDASYFKALEKFRDPDWRKIFVKMPIDRKKYWLKNIELV